MAAAPRYKLYDPEGNYQAGLAGPHPLLGGEMWPWRNDKLNPR